MTDKILEADQIYDVIIRDDGSLSVSSEILKRVGLNPGDPVKVVIANGEVKLVPMRLVVSQIAAEINQIMLEEGVTLDDLLAGLDEAGEEVFHETYGDAASDATTN
jgi:hypothetical protein